MGAAGALQYQNRDPTHLCVPRDAEKVWPAPGLATLRGKRALGAVRRSPAGWKVIWNISLQVFVVELELIGGNINNNNTFLPPFGSERCTLGQRDVLTASEPLSPEL